MPRRSRGRNATVPDHNEDLLEQTLAPSRVHSPPILDRPPRSVVGRSDLRRWDPAVGTAREAAGRPARIVHAPPRQGRSATAAKPLRPSLNPRVNWNPRASFRFETGATIPICVRRKTRREVLHALSKTKSGKGSPKKRNRWSSIKC